MTYSLTHCALSWLCDSLRHEDPPSCAVSWPCPPGNVSLRRAGRAKRADAKEGCTLCISPLHAAVDFDLIPALYLLPLFLLFPRFFCWSVATCWVSGESRQDLVVEKRSRLLQNPNHIRVRLCIDDSIKACADYFFLVFFHTALP